MSRLVFVYGTLRRGFPNHEILERWILRDMESATTVEAFPLIVPRAPFCTSPGCRFIHRTGVLCEEPGEGFQVEGDLFEIEETSLAALDRLESYDPRSPATSTYLRRTIRVRDGEGRTREAECYFLADPEPFRALVRSGRADMARAVTPERARSELKPCCVRSPRHDGPHDIIEPPAPPSRQEG